MVWCIPSLSAARARQCLWALPGTCERIPCMSAAQQTTAYKPEAPAAGLPPSSADQVNWDLSDLYSGASDPRIGADLDGALRRARTFEETYRGRIDVPGGPPAELLLEAVCELEALYEQ